MELEQVVWSRSRLRTLFGVCQILLSVAWLAILASNAQQYWTSSGDAAQWGFLLSALIGFGWLARPFFCSRYRVDADGVGSQDDLASGWIKWKDIRRVEVKERKLLLHVRRGLWSRRVPLPEDPATREALLTALRTHLPETALPETALPETALA